MKIVLKFSLLAVLFFMVNEQALAAANHILITEVQYDTFGSESGEWVEIFNPTSSSASLDGWTLEEGSGSTFTFPSVSLGSGTYLLLAKNEAVFDTNYIVGDFLSLESTLETSTKLLGNRLNNTGDSLLLKNSTGASVDYVAWEQVDWIHNATSGQTLSRKNSTDADNSFDWEVSGTIGIESGTPGTGTYLANMSVSEKKEIAQKQTQTSSSRRYKQVYVSGSVKITITCSSYICAKGLVSVQNNKEKVVRFSFNKDQSTST